MRFFFLEWVNDFEKMMLDSLAKENPVYQINRVMRRFKSINNLLPGERLKKLHKKLHCAIRFSAIKKDDVVICNGYSVFPFLDAVREMPCKKILILRDSVAALTFKRRKLGHLGQNEDYIATVKPIFDVIFSFDPQDSEKYNLQYIKQFVPFTWQQINDINNKHRKADNSCFYVGGYDEHRVNIINALSPVLTENGIATDFYLVDKDNNQQNYPANCKNKKLSYAENIQKLTASRLVLEVNKPNQAGLTLRAVEALVFNKQLITNNAAIKEHEFYHPTQFFVYDGSNERELAQFLQHMPTPQVSELGREYSADGMLDTLKKHV